MMRMLKPNRLQVRRAIPRPVRQLLYDLSPSRERRWRRVPGIRQVPPSEGIVLTFDDGPDDRSTAQVLDALDASEAKATFFVLGERVREKPDLALELLVRGHEVALHGMVHRRHDTLSEPEAKKELSAGLEAIEATLQYRPRWYRPPFGRASAQLASVCEELDLGLVYWTVTGHDWEPIPAAKIARIALRDIGPGAVVLLHDSATFNPRDDAGPTIDAIPIISDWARRKGLPLASLGAALDSALGVAGR